MTPFSLSSRVVHDRAKQDKIELNLGIWYVQGSESALRDYFRGLGSEPATISSPSTACETQFRLFNSPVGKDPTTPRIHIPGGEQNGDRHPIGVPLISGHLQTRRSTPRLSERRIHGYQCRSLEARLSINPTRFVNHQNMVPSDVVGPEDGWAGIEPRFTTRATVRHTALETSLDGNDNVLLSQRALVFGRPALWPIHLEQYYQTIQSTLDNHIRRVAQISGLLVHQDVHLNLRSVETYWEFSDEDPTAVVSALAGPVCSYAENCATRTYSQGLIETNADGNSRSLRVRLGSGRILRIYAKTTGRVRFEIEHDLVKNSRLLADCRHTSTLPSVFKNWIQQLAVSAADDVNTVLDHVASQSAHSPLSWRRSYHLVHAIAEVTNQREITRNLLSLLVNNHGIHLTRNDPLRPYVRRLLEYGVVARVAPRSQQFVIHISYRRALEELSAGWTARDDNSRFHAIDRVLATASARS